MGFFDRTKAILFKTEKEWAVIETENKPHAKVFIEHLLILALIPTVLILIAFGFLSLIGGNTLSKGIIMAVMTFITLSGVVYVTAAVINAFSEQFGAVKDFNRTFSLLAYSLTPFCVLVLFIIVIPILGILVSFLGFFTAFTCFILVLSRC